MSVISGKNAKLLVNGITLYASRWKFTVTAQEEDVTIVETGLTSAFIRCKEWVLGVPRVELEFDAFWDADDNPYHGTPNIRVGSSPIIRFFYQRTDIDFTSLDGIVEQLTAIPDFIRGVPINGWNVQALFTRVEETAVVRDVIRYTAAAVVQRYYVAPQAGQFNFFPTL